MSTIIKLLRVFFFLALYFVLCMVAVVTVFTDWSPGAQMLFAFLTPIALVWWGEKRRSRRHSHQPTLDTETAPEQPANSSKRPSSPPKKSRFEKRIDQEREQIRQSAVGERVKPTAASVSVHTKPAESTNACSQTGQYRPPKQDYAAIVKAGRSSASELAEIAAKKEAIKAKSAKKKATRRTGWVPSSDTVQIAGRDIGGMIYVGTPPRLNDFGYRDKCRAYIDPSLSVARSGTDLAGDEMPYWPSYSDISANSRATYLDWLASGAKDGWYDAGYMFLYFYGLERRFFLDKPPEAEKREILQEVRRLQNLYPDNGSVQRYLGEFIQLAQVSLNDEALEETIFEFRGWDIPLSLKVAIGARLNRGELLSADWVLSWLLCHPERRMRTPSTRCAEEFRALFNLRFEERFPDGLKVNKPRKMLKITYQAASSEFQGQLEPLVDGNTVPDISGLRKPVEIAQEIADEVMDDLDKLSRYLGRNPDGRGSLEAQALLPRELWDLFPSEELEHLRAWAATIVHKDGLVPVLDVVEQLEGERPEKLSKRTLTGVADALARLGYGFAPDPRFALRSPKPGEPVVLFDLGDAVAQLEDVSDGYRAALIEIALGSFVAHADGQISESERKSLRAKIAGVAGLSEQEHRRLAANLDWMLAVPPDLALLKRKLKDTGPEAQASIRSALVAAAHADGIIQPEEVAGIEKIYKSLGLDPSLVYSDIHAGNVSDGPVRVRAAEPGAVGEVIPDEKPAGAPKLDAARIAAIQSDTARVSSVLGDIFDEASEELEEIGSASAALAGLDTKQTNLVRALIAQEHWTEEAFEDLCRQSGLLASGAIEDINEWAFGTYDEALLDEYDGYEVAPDLAQELKKKFEEETDHVEA
ncbi:tellurite resistance TerB family protein [Phaeobacter inhibens]|uniref:tellurite resistance TerB family protein n=1 Tax=Phaeobacter inhibens TaxID=221822 RepID=UPI0021A77A37|nr:TerB N-terminal domain-containing protein [Phaeobacter inhibens]UWS07070.1 TerB N-terminal domain-containing protein [Phaeobacter inhibens]